MAQQRKNVLLLADADNAKGYASARSCLQHFSVSLPRVPFKTILALLHHCKLNKIDAVVCCDSNILALLLAILGKATSKPSCQSWAGASFVYRDVQFVFTRGFAQIKTTSTGRFIFTRHVYKCLAPTYQVPDLVYDVVEPNTPSAEEFLNTLRQSILVAVDIETSRQPTTAERVEQVCAAAGVSPKGIAAMLKDGQKQMYAVPKIDMCGYYCVWHNPTTNRLEGKAFNVYLKSMDHWQLMKTANATDTPKICQNGGYESTYFIRYGIPMVNFVGDTFHAMHSWMAELPRTLDFIAGLFLPNFEYWKDLIDVDTNYYNALDTYSTAWCWILILLQWPEWAERNYHIEFRKLFVNVCMGLEGVKVDLVERERLRCEYQAKKDEAFARLQVICGKDFNPGSSPKTLALMNALAKPRVLKSSDEKAIDKWAEMHPVHTRIAELIKDYREASKALSTYITANLFEDRLLYELNSGGTKTGRSSSKASNLWVGTQIQNQDTSLRTMYIADEGYTNCSIDGSQAESRTTAYLSQDLQLIDSVETAKDFHSRNASLFFGVPEEEIVKLLWETKHIDGVEIQVPVLDENGKQKKDKSLRDLAKRVNHGANYNMAAYMLVRTMGMKNIMKAAKILQLPATWRSIAIAGHLLQLFERAYPRVKGTWYDEIIEEIRTTSLLTLPNGWTRRCFGTPSRLPEHKKYLNEYAAHGPQSLSVMLVDEGIFDFWIEYQIHRGIARMKAQVHDEGIFQAKPDVVWECAKGLSELLMRPLEVHGRTLVIPNNGGTVNERWSELKD